MTGKIFHEILLSFMRHIAHSHDKKRPIRKKMSYEGQIGILLSIFACKIIDSRAL